MSIVDEMELQALLTELDVPLDEFEQWYQLVGARGGSAEHALIKALFVALRRRAERKP